jgi:hypothetical protein
MCTTTHTGVVGRHRARKRHNKQHTRLLRHLRLNSIILSLSLFSLARSLSCYLNFNFSPPALCHAICKSEQSLSNKNAGEEEMRWERSRRRDDSWVCGAFPHSQSATHSLIHSLRGETKEKRARRSYNTTFGEMRERRKNERNENEP